MNTINRKISTTTATQRANENKERVEIALIREELFEVIVQNEHLSVVAMTPNNQDEFIYGYLHSKGIIEYTSDIVSMRLCEANRFHLLLSERVVLNINNAGGLYNYIVSKVNTDIWKDIPSIKSDEKYNISSIKDYYELADSQDEIRNLSKSAVYIAVVSAEGVIDKIFYDVNLCNAFDKVKGSYGISNKVSNILLTNGAVNAELALRMVKAGVPLCLSTKVPTSAAVNIIKSSNLTLIGQNNPREYLIFSDNAKRITNQ